MRTSQKQVEKILSVLSNSNNVYRLVKYENLGNRANVYYTYSVVIDMPIISENGYYIKDYKRAVERVISNKSLKEVYDTMFQIMQDKFYKTY